MDDTNSYNGCFDVNENDGPKKSLLIIEPYYVSGTMLASRTLEPSKVGIILLFSFNKRDLRSRTVKPSSLPVSMTSAYLLLAVCTSLLFVLSINSN